MTETFSIEVQLPEFMRLLDAEARKAVFEEIRERVQDQVDELFEKTAKEILAQKLDIHPSSASVKEKVPEEKKGTEVKSTLSQEILSLSGEDALRALKMALARGEIDNNTYEELKMLVKPAGAPSSGPATASRGRNCPKCGKELQPAANFCRFCGLRLK